MTSRAIVLARGLGRRMQQTDAAATMTEDQLRAADAGLKAMMPVGGRPFLDFILGSLADAGVSDVALVVAPEHEAVRRYYADHPAKRSRLAFVVQRNWHAACKDMAKQGVCRRATCRCHRWKYSCLRHREASR